MIGRCSSLAFALPFLWSTAMPALASAQSLLAERLTELREARDLPPREKLEAALSLVREARGADSIAGNAYRIAAYGAAGLEDYRAAAAYEAEAAKLCERARDLACAAKANSNAGAYLTFLDDIVGALRTGAQAARLFTASGDPAAAAQSRYNMGVVRSSIGDFAGALTDIDAANPYLRPSPNGVYPGLWHAARAQMLVELGRHREALADAERAVSFAKTAEDKFNTASFRTEAWRTLSKVQFASGKRREAVLAARTALHEATEVGGQDETLARIQLADALLAQNQVAEALQQAKAALSGLDELRERERAEQLLVVARAYSAGGRADLAAALFEKAYRALDRSVTSAAGAQTANALAAAVVADREAEAARLMLANAQRAAADAERLARLRMLMVGTAAIGLLAVAGVWFRAHEREARQRMEVMLAERARVAGEVHDTLMSGVAAAAQQIALASEAIEEPMSPVADRLSRASAIVRSTLSNAREAIWDLRAPVTGAEIGDALHQTAAEALGGARAHVELSVSGEPQRLPSLIASTFVRVAREAIVNAVRHGAADRLRLRLDVRTDVAQFSVSDNGSGFVVGQHDDNVMGHWGLTVMRERMERVGGRLTVLSTPGEGTVVTAEAQL